MSKAKIYYYDIGDYLNREEKLNIIKEFGSISNIPWKTLKPNTHGDWINKRNESFETFIPLNPHKKFEQDAKSFFIIQSPGILSSRESWVYNFSREILSENMSSMINFYEKQRRNFINETKQKEGTLLKDIIDNNPRKISWTRALRRDLKNNKTLHYKPETIKKAVLRPFFELNLYNDRDFIESPGLLSQFFPNTQIKNLVICVSGKGANKRNCILISDKSIDYNAIDAGAKCFPLYYYEERNKSKLSLFDEGSEKEYVRRDGISDFILERAKRQYGKNVSKEDIFYYVYGFLHSKDYRETFANDLKKMLPRLPLIEDVRKFWKFSKAGRALAELHLNYEEVPPYEGVQVEGAEALSFLEEESADSEKYIVQKMRFPKRGKKDTILYNSKITIRNIPEKAYEYVVNGKSAIEWIMERYQVKTDKKSGITNDPNDWAKEHEKPRYILDLLLSIINVSVQTVDIVNSLPKVDFEEE